MSVSPRTAAPEPWFARTERARLKAVAQWHDSRRGLNRELAKWMAARIIARAGGTRCLEMGCANAVMTEELSLRFSTLDVVDGAATYVHQARAVLGGRGKAYQCLFEEFDPTDCYDAVVMAWVLEHVADPQAVLARARHWLAPHGTIHLVVPNAESLHRRVGLHMGLLHHLTELNESDRAIGHRRVYTWDRLADDIAAAELRLVTMEGVLLKSLPSTLMESWPREVRAAFFELAPLAPRLCSEIYAICTHRDHEDAAPAAHRLR
jgi:SAM-dependent methyltransferase